MSLGQEFPKEVPADTAKLAQKLYKKKKNIYIAMGNTVPELFGNADFQDLYSRVGQHAINPVLMTLITLVQFMENLSDREMMDAIIGRIDLKYLFRLPLEHPGFNPSDLTKFRNRLVGGSLDREIFDRVFELASKRGLVNCEKQRTDSTHLIASVATLTRTELIIEAMQKALDMLAKKAPDFTKGVAKDLLALSAYTQRGMSFRMPKKDAQLKALAETVAKDAKFLLEEIERDAASFGHAKEIVVLRRILGEQFDINDHGQPNQKDQKNLAKSNKLLGSPHDTDARYNTKRSTSWLGYQLQVTETCGGRTPPIITDVRITPATVRDSDMLHKIQRCLMAKGVAPKEHLVDSGYTSHEHVRKSEEAYKITVLGPIQEGNSWQKTADKGFDASNFIVDWERESVTCPAGKKSQKWIKRKDRNAVHVRFDAATCSSCPFKENCTKAETSGRCLEIKSKELLDFQETRKKSEQSGTYWQKYRLRAGIEGTLSRIANYFGMRRSRYKGLRKTELQANLAAAALNLVRVIETSLGLKGSVSRVSPLNQVLAS